MRKKKTLGTGTEENPYSRVRGTEDFEKLGTGTGTGTGRFLDAKVLKEYGQETSLEFKYGYGDGYGKNRDFKYGSAFRTRTRTPGYGIYR